MEREQWSYRYYLLVAVGILLTGILAAGCGPASPTPGTVKPAPGTVAPLPTETARAYEVLLPFQVRRERPEVLAGPGEPLPRLKDENWVDLPERGLVTTDDNGEGWVKISQEGEKCGTIYIFQHSKLTVAPCPKSDHIARSVTCYKEGFFVYKNFCKAIIIETLSAEIRLEGTWVAVGYLPEQQVTVVMVFDADEEKVDRVTVWPVQKLDPRILGEPPVEVVEEHFWFTMPGVRADPIAGLEARVAHPFERLLPLVEALDLWAWIDRIKVRADDDNVPYPDFPPFGPTPTWTPTATPTPPPPTPTATPCGPPPNWVVYVVQANDTLFSLATKTRTTVEQVKRANCLVGDAIFVGQRLYLPFVPATPTPTATPCGPPANWVLYTVQARDTLFSLATKTRTTVEQIKRANCLVGDAIFVGQRLYLPFEPVPTLTPTPTSTPTPPPTLTPVALLQVKGVEFVKVDYDPEQQKERVTILYELTTKDLEAPPELDLPDMNAIRVIFINKRLDPSTVRARGLHGDPKGGSFVVWSQESRDYVPGLASVEPDDQDDQMVARFFLGVASPGTYQVRLFGDKPEDVRPVAISAPDETRLDGEPVGLPSGDGTEGGNFVFEFTIIGPE